MDVGGLSGAYSNGISIGRIKYFNDYHFRSLRQNSYYAEWKTFKEKENKYQEMYIESILQ
jgi:hypothetical protein